MSDGFGAKLKELREAKGLTQPELAELAGMNQYGIAKLEQGVNNPRWETVKALAAALGVSCEVFNEEPAEREPPGPGRPRKPEPEEKPAEPKPSGEKRKRGKKGG